MKSIKKKSNAAPSSKPVSKKKSTTAKAKAVKKAPAKTPAPTGPAPKAKRPGSNGRKVTPAPAKPVAPTKKTAARKAAPTAATPPSSATKPSAAPVVKAAAASKKKSGGEKKTAPVTKKPAVTPSAAAPKPAAVKKPAAVPVKAPKTSPTTTAPVASKKAQPRAKVKPSKRPPVPPILLEGDRPPAPARRGPGSRYELGGERTASGSGDELELPEAYGTRRLYLVARDPQWLYANWDLTDEQLKSYNQLAKAGHLTLRIFEGKVGGPLKSEVEVHPESRSWFVHVGKGGSRYVAELGFRDKLGVWHDITVSDPASTPPDSLSDNLEAVFASLPKGIAFEELVGVIRQFAAAEPGLKRALDRLQETHRAALAGAFPPPQMPSPKAPAWTEGQQRALADVLSMEEVKRTWIGSQVVTEVIRGRRSLSSESAIPAGAVSSLSSPFGGETEKGKGRGFWFNVNAELIIYGATEPDASVTIGGRTIRLRKDGTFSYRFALPDGDYALPVQATSADQVESRSAALHFVRETDYRGDVGQHPQDATLKQPRPENVA